MNIAELLRAQMTQRGDQKRLAIKLDVEQSTVSQWVKGKTEPTADKWHAIEDLLGLERHSIAMAKGNVPSVDALPEDETARRLGLLEAKLDVIETLLERYVDALEASEADD